MDKEEIEVEKKFQPTKEQFESLVSDALYKGEKKIIDEYYDYTDYNLVKQGRLLRKRDGAYELKVYKDQGTLSGATIAPEITDETEIIKILGLYEEKTLEDQIGEKLNLLCRIETIRNKYIKGDFVITDDKTDFGYYICEIEKMVSNESEIKNAENEIIELAKAHNFEILDLPLKTTEWMKRMKPELYREIFGNKEAHNELNKLK